MIRPGTPRSGAGAGTAESQPRPVEDARRPSAAERVRTLVDSSVSARLVIPGAGAGAGDPPGAGAPGARAVTPEGEVILLVPADSPAGRAAGYAQHDELQAVLEITDVAPVAVPCRIRGRGWAAGWITAVPEAERAAAAQLLARRHPSGPAPGARWAMVRLEIGEASVDDLWGEGAVEPEEFAAAAPDPLVRHEAELLQHMAASHDGHLRALCTLLGDEPETVCGAWDRVAPLALDRHGMRVRFVNRDRCCDARFEFAEPVRDVAGLRREMHRLFAATGD